MSELVNAKTRKIDELTKQVIELQKLAPSEICAKYQVQDCSHCDRIDCGDNTSSAKQKILELEQEIAGLQEKCKSRGKALQHEIWGHAVCLSIANGESDWEEAEESSPAIAAVKRLRQGYEEFLKAFERAQKTADGVVVYGPGMAVWEPWPKHPRPYTVGWSNDAERFMAYLARPDGEVEVMDVRECYSTLDKAIEAYKNDQPDSPDTDEVDF